MTSWKLGTRTLEFGSRTYIMGILNVTPDSFSDGGRFLDPARAVEHALKMAEDGADIIDIGGESTRPRGTTYGSGAEPVSAEEENARILPIIKSVTSQLDVPVSVDTTKAEVAERALDAGAVMINDISGLRFDARMPGVVGRAGASLAVMHTRAAPSHMPADPVYADLFGEISAYLAESVAIAQHEGITQIMVDPGIGFGKNTRHNLRLVAGVGRFAGLGCPILIGPSRKAFIGHTTGLPVEERMEGTLAAVVAAVLAGAHVVRVHDVLQVRRALLVADALRRARDENN
jgi:dihydropteroate synthase